MESQLEQIDEKGKPPSSRLKDAASCRAVFELYFNADKDAARKRAANQRMFDGEPPYKHWELERAGQKFRTNINLGEAEDLLGEALGSYIDMLQSVEVLFKAPTRFGDTPEQRKRYSKGVCLAVSNMVKRWPDFDHQFMVNATNFISQGVSFAFFPDDIDWRFKVKGLNDTYLPRDADASEDKLELLFVRDHFTVSRLYGTIRDEKAAEEVGWNVRAVREAIGDACDGAGRGATSKSWEDFATEIKTDDLHISAKTDAIEMLYCFVREFDGTISQYILPRQGTGEYVFARKGRYKSMVEAMTMFAYSVGYRGKVHEIRGLGSKIFSAIQVNNRMYCQGIDGTMLSSSLMVKPRSMSDLGKAQLAFHGPYTLLHPGAEVVETGTPNFAQNTFPVVRQMSDLIRSKAMGYTSSRALPEGQEMSRFEASARISNAAGMTVTNQVLFLKQFEKLLRQIVRRVQRRGYAKELPGGEAVHEMLAELAEAGIPFEALEMLDINRLEATRPVGAGSPAARYDAFRKLRELAPGFDEEGRRNLTRDSVADIIGSYSGADDYVPPEGEERVADGTKIAILENHQMAQGVEIPAFSEEFHVTHLEVHTQFMADYIRQTEEGQLRLEEAVPVLMSIHQHCVAHLGYIEGDPMNSSEASRFREVLQQSGEIISNGLRRIHRLRQQEAAQQAEGGGEEAQAHHAPPAMEKHEMDLRMAMEKHEVSMRILEDKAEREAALAMMKANAAAQIAEAQAAAKLRPPLPKF